MVTAADVLGLSPGYKFDPADDEVVEYYLLPRLLGEKSPLEGMILEDDPLSAPPWELLRRHKREDEAFFFAQKHMIHGKGSRNKRTCVGGGCWEGQKAKVDGEKLIVPDRGMEISWKKYLLNFHNDGEKGSTGWVMHEYSVTAPADLASSSVRLYRIRFTGHGQKRQREPDDLCGDDGGARAATRQRQAIAQSNLPEQEISASYSVFPQDGYGGAAIGWNQWAALTSSDQNYQAVNATDDHHLLGFSEGFVDVGVGTPAVSYQAAPAGVMHEFAGAAPAAGTLPFGQGSHSSAIDGSILDFELPENIDLDDFLANIDFDDLMELPERYDAQLDGEFSGAGMQPMPNSHNTVA